MNQAKFVWVSKNIPKVLDIEMDPDGITTVKLHSNINITHNSNKRDKVEIIFKDDNSKFVIPNEKVLNEIYKIFIQNKDAILPLYKYCENKLARC